jgi:hypothetical protein
MTITRHIMTDEQRKSVALEYLKAFDNKGVTSNEVGPGERQEADRSAFHRFWRRDQIDPARLLELQLDHDRDRRVRRRGYERR